VPYSVTRRRRLSTLSLCCAGFLISFALVTMLGGPCHPRESRFEAVPSEKIGAIHRKTRGTHGGFRGTPQAQSHGHPLR
jgi:hypothetical protein